MWWFAALVRGFPVIQLWQDVNMPRIRNAETFVRQHPTLTMTGFLVTVAGLRIFAFADFRLPTALALMAVVDHVSVLVATLKGILARVGPFLFFVKGFGSGSSSETRMVHPSQLDGELVSLPRRCSSWLH
jgi:hypothetical protein